MTVRLIVVWLPIFRSKCIATGTFMLKLVLLIGSVAVARKLLGPMAPNELSKLAMRFCELMVAVLTWHAEPQLRNPWAETYIALLLEKLFPTT